MHHVDAHVSRAGDTEQRVQVRAIAVDEAAAGVHDLADLGDLLLEEPERVRVGDHQARDLFVHQLGDRVRVQDAVTAGRNGDDVVSVERGTGGVGAVGRVGDEDLLARRIAALLVIGADHHDAGQFSLGARRRLQRHAVHAADFGQPLFELPRQFEESLGRLGGRERVRVGEAREPRSSLVHLGVVLHRARTERVEPEVDGRVPGGEAGEVAHHVDLAHLRQLRQVVARQVAEERVDVDLGDVQGRELGAAPPRPRAFEDQILLVAEAASCISLASGGGVAHERPPASALRARSIASRLASSVAQNNTAGPRPGAVSRRSSPATAPA